MCGTASEIRSKAFYMTQQTAGWGVCCLNWNFWQIKGECVLWGLKNLKRDNNIKTKLILIRTIFHFLINSSSIFMAIWLLQGLWPTGWEPVHYHANDRSKLQVKDKHVLLTLFSWQKLKLFEQICINFDDDVSLSFLFMIWTNNCVFLYILYANVCMIVNKWMTFIS